MDLSLVYGPTNPHHRRHLDWLSRFRTAHDRDQQKHTQTVNTICATIRHKVMRLNNDKLQTTWQHANLHTAQLMLLPLTVSCSSKIQTGFTFLVSAHPGSPGQRAVKRMYVCMYDKFQRQLKSHHFSEVYNVCWFTRFSLWLTFAINLSLCTVHLVTGML